jgi:hypothetical protein
VERREGGVDEIGDHCIPQGLWVNVGHMFGIRCPLKPFQELVRIHNAGGLRTVSSSGFIVSGSKPNAFGDERTYFVRSLLCNTCGLSARNFDCIIFRTTAYST